MIPLFDAHGHLSDEGLRPQRDRILGEMVEAGIRGAVVNGTSENDWPEVAAFCSGVAAIKCLPSFGLHPWEVGNRSKTWENRWLVRLDETPRAGIGEIGLDRWMLERARPNDPRLAGRRRAPLAEQLDVFHHQFTVAAERNLPASIHCIDAYGALHDALRAVARPKRGFLLHAYSGPAEMVHSFAGLGAYFSFNGAFLDPGKERLRAVYTGIPLERLLVETDAPAMIPPPFARPFYLPAAKDGRGLNHPANLAAAYQGLAAWRGIALNELAIRVENNFKTFFEP